MPAPDATTRAITRRRGATARTALVALTFASAAMACTLLRSLDDLGNGVAPIGDDASTLDGGGADGDPTLVDGALLDVAPPVCGPEIDLDTDPKNCHVCGRACLDADPCEKGACRFATTAGEGSELALGGGWLAYVDGQSIWARKTTGGDRLFVTDTHTNIRRIATSGAHVYWTTEGAAGGVFRCALPSCTSVETLASPVVHPHDIVLDGTNVYWSNSGGTYRCGFNRPVGNITVANLDGTNKRAFITQPQPIESVTDITQIHIRAPYMYWGTDTCGFDGGSAQAQLWRQPLAGGQPGVQLAGVGVCHFIDLTGDDADLHYGCEYTRVATTSLTPQSGAKQWSTTGLRFPRIASDGTRVFWTVDTDPDPDPDAGMPGARFVYAQKKTDAATTTPETVWTKSGTNRGLRAIAVDDRWLYFADPDDRKIRAIPK